MNLEKILNEIGKTKERIASYEERLKELEKKKFEAENLELISIVRKNKISRKDLDDFIKQKITIKEIENKESEEILNGKEEREKNKYQGI
ncbi:DUF4315 family protein [Clostridium sp. BJN0001]|uniref:DUF4315 family protein n=1 Tax=Clostridium sp. BJN0001 TaxID=2930219 RepID=UPI001FD318CE|nr:DUF4315 family protein [Clostridium sp. BJN0001]